MRALRSLLAWVALAAAGHALAAPEMLVVQLLEGTAEQAELNMPIYPEVGAEFDAEGRVNVILWSMTDVVFRTAVEEGKIKVPERVTIEDARKVVRDLNIAYLLVFSAKQTSLGVEVAASLYRGTARRALWSDTKVMNVLVGGAPDLSSLGSTVGRTWVAIFGQGPFKDLPPRPRIRPSDPAQGERLVQPATPPTAGEQVPAELEAAKKLLSSGDVIQAVLKLRELTDVAPFSVDVRRTLVEALLASGEPGLAASEAARAAQLLPDAAAMRVTAAEAYAEAGRLEDARRLLNEAIARDATVPEAHVVGGYLSMKAGDFAGATKALSHAKTLGTTGVVDLLLGFCLAVTGDAAGASESLESLGGEVAPVWLDRVSAYFGPVCAAFSDDCRSLLQRIRVRRDAPTTLEEMDRLSGLITGLSVWSSAGFHSPETRRRFESLNLGLQQIKLVIEDFRAYSKSGDEQVLTDAALLLSDGLRNIKASFETPKETR